MSFKPSNFTCSTTCLNVTCLDDACSNCDVINETCLHGCQQGWYGLQCENACPLHCATNNLTSSVCDQHDGACLNGCNPGHFGSGCNVTCATGCYGKRCDRVTGECVNGCLAGFRGRLCSGMYLRLNNKCTEQMTVVAP